MLFAATRHGMNYRQTIRSVGIWLSMCGIVNDDEVRRIFFFLCLR